MIAAIYARKSQDDGRADDDENKSVARQEQRCRQYAASKGWTVDETYIYVDDGISGAEFVQRPGLTRMMAALRPRPPFQILIMSEQNRLGRDSIRTLFALQQILEAGVAVWEYLADRQVALDNEMDEIQAMVQSWSGSLHRRETSRRVRDTMQRKAKALHVTGGRVYGYRNTDVLGAPDADGRRKRLHVVREILPEQAEVIRRIFRLYAEGAGFKRSRTA